MSREVSDIVNNLAAHPISLYMHVSGISLLSIDWLSTLDVEITQAWGGRWNLGRMLYFITRYSVFLDVAVEVYYKSTHSIPPSLCAHLDGIWGPFTIAEGIMTVRVWALWGRRRTLGIFLVILSIVNATASSIAYLRLGPHYQYVSMGAFSTIFPGCFRIVTSATTNSWSFIPLIVHQTHGADAYGTSLIGTFYRDGITYYALLVAFSIVNLAAIIQQSDMIDPYFLTFLQRILHSILSARMLLHLRREFNTSQNSKPLTSIKFADVESPGGPPSTFTTSEERNIRNDSWFGQEEISLQLVQSSGQSVEQVARSLL